MDSQDPTIEEKLVPFVEGALAEADRREVLQALPNQPALNQEVRQLREAILTLRSQAARGLSYQSPVEAPPEQVVDFALQGEQWSRQSSRQFQLHLLESASIADELSILRELEQDLQQRVEPGKSVPEMPAALRLAIQETYGKPPADPAWKRAAAAIVAWTAGLNLKVASAALAGCVLVVGAVSVGRYAHQQMETSSSTVAVSTAAPAAGGGASPVLAAAATPEAAPVGQVALLQEKVLPEDLPGLSRRLWTKQVSHSYRDGQIYVAQADFDKAWSALQMNNEKIATAKPLKTGGIVPAADKQTNLLDGVIGQLPAMGDRKEPKPKPKQPSGGAVADAAAVPGNMIGGVPDPVKAVEVALPPAPEASQGGYAPPPPPAPVYYLPASRSKDHEEQPVVAQQRQSVPAATRPSMQVNTRRTAYTQPTHVAAPTPQSNAHPSQMAYERIPSETPVKSGDEGAVKSKISQVFQPKNSRKASYDQLKPADALPTSPEPAVEAQAPAIQPLQRPSAPPPRVNAAITPTRQQNVAVAAPAPVAAPITAPASNANLDPANEEDSTPPPSQVALETKKAESPRDKSETQDGRLQSRSDDAPGRPLTKQAYTENAGASRVAMGASSSRAGLGKVQDESFQVQAGAPFEVAMLPVAKKLVEDLVGESKVQMERKEDGHLLVTIRPARSLSPQEVDKLRKVVREKLELKEEDTVVIRQP